MNITRRLGFVLLIFAALLLVPALILAQSENPPVPHTLKGYDDCLGCHGNGIVGATPAPDSHSGIKGDVCVVCHQPVSGPPASPSGEPLPVPHFLTGREDCQDCHHRAILAPTDDPPIPHTMIDRQDCLKCHRDGDEITPRAPDNHAGLTSAICQNCHLPAEMLVAPKPPAPAAAGPVPTPVAHPEPVPGVNTCFDCHSTLDDANLVENATRWQRSIHAERDVTCVDCHGGDSSSAAKEEAKAPDTGYIGEPAKTKIPALCASCHADVTKMRQYDLPTDQYNKYRESIHGFRLAQGDPNVATCADCHNDHMILKANDPASSVYPANVPQTCANCHADETLMAAYDIRTNQFALYKESVHGHALLDEQNFRAPNCATCHGTHGAAPPGFDEVANVCGSCHSATQDYYLQSAHFSHSEQTPKCITCHGRYDVTEPGEAMFLGGEPRHCGSCHAGDSEPGQVARALNQTITAAAEAIDESETAIEAARDVGMLVAPLEEQLRDANTNLIIARAAQHTLNFDTVNERAATAVEVAGKVKVGAEDALAENLFRRRAMIIAVVAIVFTMAALYLLKRELDRGLEAEEE